MLEHGNRMLLERNMHSREQSEPITGQDGSKKAKNGAEKGAPLKKWKKIMNQIAPNNGLLYLTY